MLKNNYFFAKSFYVKIVALLLIVSMVAGLLPIHFASAEQEETMTTDYSIYRASYIYDEFCDMMKAQN